MLLGELRYKGRDHEKVARRLFKINNDIELFSKDTQKFPICKMARKIIPPIEQRFYNPSWRSQRRENHSFEGRSKPQLLAESTL